MRVTIIGKEEYKINVDGVETNCYTYHCTNKDWDRVAIVRTTKEYGIGEELDVLYSKKYKKSYFAYLT